MIIRPRPPEPPEDPKPPQFKRVRVVTTDETGDDRWWSLAEFLEEFPVDEFPPSQYQAPQEA